MKECMFCHGPLTGRHKTFCSDKCRMGHKRADKRLQDRVQSTISDKPEQIHQPEHEQTRTTEPEQQTRTATLQDYYDHMESYVPRQEPERMNWGAWMDMDQLKARGFKCNRVAIPGDWDYQGCVPAQATAAPVDEHKAEDNDPLGRIHSAEGPTASVEITAEPMYSQ